MLLHTVDGFQWVQEPAQIHRANRPGSLHSETHLKVLYAPRAEYGQHPCRAHATPAQQDHALHRFLPRRGRKSSLLHPATAACGRLTPTTPALLEHRTGPVVTRFFKPGSNCFSKAGVSFVCSHVLSLWATDSSPGRRPAAAGTEGSLPGS